MDEEVMLESSPLYQHLKQIELEDKGIFDGSPLEGLEDTTFHHDTSTISDQPTESSIFFSFQEDILGCKRSICNKLLNSTCLLEEHHLYLGALLQSYYPDLLPSETEVSSSHGTSIRLLVHGLTSILCAYKASSTVKYIAAASWLVHAALPAVRNSIAGFVTHDLNQASNKITQILGLFKEEDLLWRSVRQFYQEINLVARGAVLINQKKTNFTNRGEDLTESIRRAAHIHLTGSIASVREDLLYLSELIDKSVLHELGLSVPDVHTLSSYDMTSLQTNHRSLLLLISQWIVFVTVLVANQPVQSKSKTAENIMNLKGINYSNYLRKELQFRKALMDGELGSKSRSQKKRPDIESAETQALHSLYLHSRELLRLSKLTADGTVSLSDDLYNQIKQQISDCAVCLERAGKRRANVNSDKKNLTLSVTPAEMSHASHNMTENEPITDQVFVTEAGEGTEEGDPEDVQTDYEAKLRQEYEAFLMRELRGVISELARERVVREQQLTNSGSPSEDLAKTTQQIVESRDIKALVKTAAEAVDQQTGSSEDSRNARPASSSSCKYRYTDEEGEGQVGGTYPSVDVRQIAQLVAARFTDAHGEAETFGSDDSDSETYSETES